MKEIEINLDRIAHPIAVGVQRAALFMGLGLNAIAREDVTDVALSSVPHPRALDSYPMDFIPRDPPRETLAQYKEEFSTWLVGASLRELMEHVALTLDMMHEAALFALSARDPAKLGSLGGPPEDLHRSFVERKGVPEKLQALRDRFGIWTPHEEALCALYRARNCLTHGLGIVTKKAADEAGRLNMAWIGMVIELVGTESGTVWQFSEMVGVALPEASEVRLRFVERVKEVQVGERIRFSHDELAEVCYFVGTPVASSLSESFIAFMKRLGVPLEAPPAPVAPKCTSGQ